MTLPKQPEQPDTKTLNDQVKDSSDKNRQFFLAYLALMAYVQATIFSTTDTMLLFSDQGTKLPLIDITVPLLGFYWVIPIFILAIHFNFLQNLEAHHFKLMQWRHTFSGKAVPRSRIQPFLFDVATFDTGSLLQSLTRSFSSFLCFYLGPTTQALVLWRMTDYQDIWLTGWHTFAFLCSCGLVYRTRQSFRKSDRAKVEKEYRKESLKTPEIVQQKSTSSSKTTQKKPRRISAKKICRSLVPISAILIVLAESALCFWVALAPTDDFLRKLNWFQTYEILHPKLPKGLAELVIPRITVIGLSSGYNIDTSRLKAISELSSTTSEPLSVWIANSESGPNFAGRSLRGAKLVALPLVGARFSNARLEGAYLVSSQLQGAKFENATLSQASFDGADLEGASFDGAELWDVDFPNSQLNGSRFIFADPIGANFGSSKIQFAVFSNANLSGAAFRLTELQGSSFGGARIFGTVFQDTDLRGADFLPGKFFDGTNPGGAYIGISRRAGAYFKNVKIQKTLGLEQDVPLAGSENFMLDDLDVMAMRKQLEETLQYRKVGYGDTTDNSKTMIDSLASRPSLTQSMLPNSDPTKAALAWVNELCNNPAWGTLNDQNRTEYLKERRTIALSAVSIPRNPYSSAYHAAIDLFIRERDSQASCGPLRNYLVDENLLDTKYLWAVRIDPRQ